MTQFWTGSTLGVVGYADARTLLHKWGVTLDLKVRRCSTALTNTLRNSDAVFYFIIPEARGQNGTRNYCNNQYNLSVSFLHPVSE